MPLSTINSNSIGNGTVIASDILDGTISSSKLVSANIAGDRLAANTLSNTVFQTGSVENYLRGASLDFGMRNRIINGAMVIDQRNAGASVTPGSGGTYTLDRWSFYGTQSSKASFQQSNTSATGFTNSLLTTSASSYSVTSSDVFVLYQPIEGYNIADLGFGGANARPITLSFWVRSSLTGTFGAVVSNVSNNRSYVFSYTINSANTFEQKIITIPGDTSGSWNATNGIGLALKFSLGAGSTYIGTANTWNAADVVSPSGCVNLVGTNAATWYVTGVQLEEGSVPTSFEYRQYTTELQLCQRYYEKSYSIDTVPGTNTSVGQYLERATAQAGGFSGSNILYVVQKRAAPTATFYRADGTVGSWNYNRSGTSGTVSVALDDAGTYQGRINMNTGSAWAATEIYGHYVLSAEL